MYIYIQYDVLVYVRICTHMYVDVIRTKTSFELIIPAQLTVENVNQLTVHEQTAAGHFKVATADHSQQCLLIKLTAFANTFVCIKKMSTNVLFRKTECVQ